MLLILLRDCSRAKAVQKNKNAIIDSVRVFAIGYIHTDGFYFAELMR